MGQVVNVWRVIPINELSEMRKDNALMIALNVGRVFVGWGAIGNMASKRLDDVDELRMALKHAYPSSNNHDNGVRALINFFDRMELGDIVLIVGNTKSAVCIVDGEYEFIDSRIYGLPEGYDHQRRIKIVSESRQDVAEIERLCNGFDDSQYVTVRKSQRKVDTSIVQKDS